MLLSLGVELYSGANFVCSSTVHLTNVKSRQLNEISLIECLVVEWQFSSIVLSPDARNSCLQQVLAVSAPTSASPLLLLLPLNLSSQSGRPCASCSCLRRSEHNLISAIPRAQMAPRWPHQQPAAYLARAAALPRRLRRPALTALSATETHESCSRLEAAHFGCEGGRESSQVRWLDWSAFSDEVERDWQ